MIIDKKKGILFWVTGLSGAGKTSISNKIYHRINKRYGKTFYINGDEMRKIFDLKSYDNKDRKNGAKKYAKLFKKITDQNINVLFAGMALFDDVRIWNKINITTELSYIYGRGVVVLVNIYIIIILYALQIILKQE